MASVSRDLEGCGDTLRGRVFGEKGSNFVQQRPPSFARLPDALSAVGRVKDFWPFFCRVVDQYVGLNAEEIQCEARAVAGVRPMRSIIDVLHLPSASPKSPTLPELVAQRRDETLPDRLGRHRKEKAARPVDIAQLLQMRCETACSVIRDSLMPIVEMKKVIDTGALRSDELEDFLKSSPLNVAVLCDYAMMEAYKGDSALNLRRSLGIVSQFPSQVLILRSTNVISRLRPRRMGLHRRFTDEKQTAGFPNYCSAMLEGAADPSDAAIDIDHKAAVAKEHFELLTTSAETVREGILKFAKSYPPETLKALRLRLPYPASLRDRVVKDVCALTALHWRTIFGGHSELPPAKRVVDSFLFRYSLCMYVLALRWIADGGIESVPAKKLSNDPTDMIFAAYATFFDGLITSDSKLMELYCHAKWLHANLFTI